MKWIGQHIYDLIARFRNDVYLENLAERTQDQIIGIDVNGKLYKQDVAAGDITSVSFQTDSGALSLASDADGDAFFRLNGSSGVGITNSGTTITAVSVPGEIDHDSLLNFAANEHFTQANITTVGTISTGVWQGDAIASAYLDADTAHLSGDQTFSGIKTFSRGLIVDGDISTTPGDGAVVHIDSGDVTDSSTSGTGTAAAFRYVSIENPRLLATNPSITTSDAATLAIKGAPIAHTNQTITRAWSMWIAGGNARFDGSIYSGTTEAMNSSGVVQVAAQTVIDHDQLANYAANEHFTQANITTTGTVTTGVWQGTAIATDYLKHKSTFELAGYAVADGTNYMMADIMSGNKAPFLHDETSIGANGTTADNPAAFLRAAGTVMPYNGTLKIWKGWGASNGTPTVDVAIFKYSPTADDATSDSLVLVKNTQFTGAGNDNLKAWSETSFSVTVTAGDILITAIKGSVNAKTAYFTSTVEIEWTS